MENFLQQVEHIKQDFINNIEFLPLSHEYININTTERLTSVTTLLAQAGLAPSYEKVEQKVLYFASEKGNVVHKALEEFVATGAYNPIFSEEIDYLKSTVLADMHEPYTFTELQMYYGNLAGTADLLIFDKNVIRIIDYKTAANIKLSLIRFQMSLYWYLLCQGDRDKYNCVDNYTQVELIVIQLAATKFAKRTIKLVDYDILQNLIDTLHGVPFSSFLPLPRNKLFALNDFYKRRQELKNELEAVEIAIADVLNDDLIQFVEDLGFTKFENMPGLSFIPTTEKNSLDTTKLKKEYPEVFKNCTKQSITKAYFKYLIKE